MLATIYIAFISYWVLEIIYMIYRKIKVKAGASLWFR